MHYDKSGETCTRCNCTGDNIRKALKSVSNDSSFNDIKIIFKEIKLEADKMPKSNTLLINSGSIEDILNGSASKNHCHSCSCLASDSTNCRTIELNDKSYKKV